MSSRPNVLFITLDQFRGDALSCADHFIVKTPNLDALAQSGVRFSRHYTQSTPCAPGRAGLYTGMPDSHNAADIKENSLVIPTNQLIHE
jgi:arylsulfatase A-like enzyme